MEKEYLVRVIAMNTNSAKRIESILREQNYDSWELKQVVMNPTTDEYMIIFERNRI
jgi:hypothetical protein